MTKLKRNFDWKPLTPTGLHPELAPAGGVLTLETPYRSEYEAGDPPEVEVSEGALFWRAVPDYGPRGLDGYALWKGRSADSESWTLYDHESYGPKWVAHAGHGLFPNGYLGGPRELADINEWLARYLYAFEKGDI